MHVVFSRDDYDRELCGKRIQVRVATLMNLRDLIDAGQLDEARGLVELMLDYRERERLRDLRNEVYHRKMHALDVDDVEGYAHYKSLLEDCTQAAKDLSI